MSFKRLKIMLSALLAGALALGGCGGAGPGASNDGGTGEVQIALTDAPGDFTAYDVKVVKVDLTRANGSEVSTLPVNARVDFTELTQTTELIAIGSLPLGAYTGIRLTLDFTDAEVYVEKDGASVRAATVDAAGAPLGVVEMPVNLTSPGGLTISQGCFRDVTLDFNLAATNKVDLAPATPAVTVTPFLVAQIEPASQKTMTVRGPLVATDPAGAYFTMGIKPRKAALDLGRVRVQVDSSTEYTVDGQTATGAAGYALLAAKGAGTAVVAEGTMTTDTGAPRGGLGSMGSGGPMSGDGSGSGPGGQTMGNGNGGMGGGQMMGGQGAQARRTFLATRVRAGSSVAGGDLDALKGKVISRRGNLLTVSGTVVDRSEESFIGRTVKVALTDTTIVRKDGEGTVPASISEISIGQKVSALGVYDAANTTLDVSAGSVRLEYTRVAGRTAALTGPTSTQGGEVKVAVTRLGGTKPEELDFTGTGKTPAEDADPAAYELATGPLSLGELLVDDPLVAVGFPAPFGQAHPDFEVVTLVDLSEVEAELCLTWMPPSATALSGVGAASLLASTAGTGMMTGLKIAGVAIPLPADAVITVVPAAGEEAAYELMVELGSTTWTDFAPFAAALKAELDQGRGAAKLFGRGKYDPATRLFTVDQLSVRVK